MKTTNTQKLFIALFTIAITSYSVFTFRNIHALIFSSIISVLAAFFLVVMYCELERKHNKRKLRKQAENASDYLGEKI
jgi:1,4-dihydroxy-2-naphthoate octaprenyltransferase